MRQLYRYITCAGASSRNWCTKYKDSLAIRRVQQGDPLYSLARYQEILQMVVNTGIIGELDHNPRYVASFFGRIQSDGNKPKLELS